MRPRTIAEISTPALIVDVAALQRNIERMAAFFAGGPARLRPHFKAHKTPEIARRQIAAGACVGLTCATVAEAEVASSLCGDVLIANELVASDKCDRAAALARHVRLTVAIDSVEGLERVSAAARRAGTQVGVLVDVDVGQARCGVSPGGAALELARRAADRSGIELRGLMGYEGHLVALADRVERETRSRAAMDSLASTARLLRDSRLPCEVVSAGGTGTYDITGRVEGITEVQAGSYALMDADYARLDLPFEQAFWVLGTVLSRPQQARCVADAGHKSVTKDHGHPLVQDVDGATLTALNDEHAVIAIPPDAPLRVGDQIRLRPSHTDPTINLHDVFYAIEGDRVVDVWPIVARGYAEHRAGRAPRHEP